MILQIIKINWLYYIVYRSMVWKKRRKKKPSELNNTILGVFLDRSDLLFSFLSQLGNFFIPNLNGLQLTFNYLFSFIDYTIHENLQSFNYLRIYVQKYLSIKDIHYQGLSLIWMGSI